MDLHTQRPETRHRHPILDLTYSVKYPAAPLDRNGRNQLRRQYRWYRRLGMIEDHARQAVLGFALACTWHVNRATPRMVYVAPTVTDLGVLADWDPAESGVL